VVSTDGIKILDKNMTTISRNTGTSLIAMGLWEEPPTSIFRMEDSVSSFSKVGRPIYLPKKHGFLFQMVKKILLPYFQITRFLWIERKAFNVRTLNPGTCFCRQEKALN
jgi:hypothetical protein